MSDKESNDVATSQMEKKSFIERYDGFKKNSKLLISKLPLLGHLVICKADDHKETFIEVTYNLIFATMPFWLGASLAFTFQSASTGQVPSYNWPTFMSLLTKSISNGELFVLSTSILAPVMFMILQDPKGSKEFPSKLPLGFLTVLTMIFCAAFFSALKVNTAGSQELIFVVSSCLAVLSLVLRYLATVYHKYRQARVEDFQEGQDEFVNNLMSHR